MGYGGSEMEYASLRKTDDSVPRLLKILVVGNGRQTTKALGVGPLPYHAVRANNEEDKAGK